MLRHCVCTAVPAGGVLLLVEEVGDGVDDATTQAAPAPVTPPPGTAHPDTAV